MYTVYTIYSESHDKIYIGYTSDIEGRLIAHNHPKNKGWTRKYMPWVIVYTETFSTKAEAMCREQKLKNYRGRQFIWTQVEQYKENNRKSAIG